MDVKVESYKGLMQHCTCDKCTWEIDTSTSENTPRACRQHVKKNPGHTVTRVYGSEFVYKSGG